jgi:glycosyltransferase involved in cell wall biosynthesis
LLISLIVPTRERSSYLRESLQTAIRIPDSQVEILVSDNASLDDTRDVVERVGDPRVRYANTGKRVSMRQNFEFALNTSRGEYVVYVGDDDGFLPGQFQFLRKVLSEQKPDVLTWTILTYGWPIGGFGRGTVRFVRSKLFGRVRQLDARDLLRHLLACELYRLVPVPAIYHGCASRAYLERLRGENGVVFNGRSPDTYFGYRAILDGGRFLHVDHPFSVNGFSPVSTGNAHQAYSATDVRSKPALQFATEMSLDAIQDVVRYFHSQPLGLFSTLETARAWSAQGAPRPDYSAWYDYILTSVATADLSVRQGIHEILVEHTERSESLVELHEAMRRSGKASWSRRRMSSWLTRLSRANSFKLPASAGGRNSVCTAAELADTILNTDYGRVLADQELSARSWYRALGRALAFRFGHRAVNAAGTGT